MLPATNDEDRTMQYLLQIYASESAMAERREDDINRVHMAYMAYTEAMREAGVLLGGNRLRPTSEATTVRAPNGKQSVMNGPFAETREQLAGYYLIEAADLDAALSWAARCPGVAFGAVEVRPVWV
jgi:hypothetical protein